MTEEHKFQEIKDDMPAPLPKGARVGEYIIGKRLSRKPVYAARRKGIKDKFVIKQAVPYDRKDGTDPLTIGNDCLKYEAELQKRCTLPNICPVTDVFEHNGHTYMVTPHLGASDFKERLERKNISSLEKIIVLESVAHSLAHCHRKNIVHLDVKPGNIIAGEEPSLIDFGAARVIGEQHPHVPPGVCIATIHSVAPEYLRFGAYCPRSDTFSFSLMAYRMLTGAEPYLGNDETFLYYDIPVFKSEKLSAYRGLGALIIRGLNTTVSQRPDMKEISDAFREHTARLHLPHNAQTAIPSPASYQQALQQKTEILPHKAASYAAGRQPQPAPLS
jgi:serine/threonine protein kinase